MINSFPTGESSPVYSVTGDNQQCWAKQIKTNLKNILSYISDL